MQQCSGNAQWMLQQQAGRRGVSPKVQNASLRACRRFAAGESRQINNSKTVMSSSCRRLFYHTTNAAANVSSGTSVPYIYASNVFSSAAVCVCVRICCRESPFLYCLAAARRDSTLAQLTIRQIALR